MSVCINSDHLPIARCQEDLSLLTILLDNFLCSFLEQNFYSHPFALDVTTLTDQNNSQCVLLGCTAQAIGPQLRFWLVSSLQSLLLKPSIAVLTNRCEPISVSRYRRSKIQPPMLMTSTSLYPANSKTEKAMLRLALAQQWTDH